MTDLQDGRVLLSLLEVLLKVKLVSSVCYMSLAIRARKIYCLNLSTQ